MTVLWLDDVTADDFDSVGGKAASLGELTAAGLPVPPGFVVSAETYRSFLDETGIAEELFEAVDVDPSDSAALAQAAEHAEDLIRETHIPESTRSSILAAYDDLDDGAASVAVRSSATAEDLPDDSFAGQQETFLNVDRARLLDAVRDCWASLFTQRAIYYRNEKGFDHDVVNIAVVVQRMVDAERSGVMFTSHPTTGDDRVIIEAAWGLGEAVVSGAVSPDRYVVDRESGEVLDVTVSTKKVMHVRDEETGETIERQVPEAKRDERVLSEADLGRLVDLGATVQAHYGEPQDVEWAIGAGDSGEDPRGDLFCLQSRPITTIDDTDEDGATDAPAGGTGGDIEAAEGGAPGVGTADGGATEGGLSGTGSGAGGDAADDAGGEVALTGFGASPGTVAGTVRIVRTLDHLDRVGEGDLIVAEMTTPDMVPAMERAAGIITDEGGMTSHASIISRELGVPAVVGTEDATETLSDGEAVTIDGDRGTVRRGGVTPADEGETEGDEREADAEPKPAVAARVGGSGGAGPAKPMTATDVKVNLSVPDAARRAADTGADGVGLLRTEHMVLTTGKTPERYIETEGADAFVSELVDGIQQVAEAFYPRPVRVRTLDAPTDEFRELEGGENEPHEHNPMLGWRGVRRSLDQPDLFTTELTAFRELYDMGYDNVEVMFPLVNDAEDVVRARECLRAAGIDPDKRAWGAMVETPAAALSIEGIVDTGVDFVSFGTNDLTQYTLAVDRNNERIADRFDELHPAVLELVESTIEVCRAADVATSICGQAASKPEMVGALVEAGITSVSPNVDAVHDVQREAKRVEQRLLLDSVR
ncbi:MAG: phosphoenolpyruvate synthase [Haloarculaceae archaeon]